MMPKLQTPETRLIQYDCGKLQVLARLLHDLKAGSHRVLIFTQMTKVLDILESFLNFHGHVYMRLDGSTRVEQRQMLMERFNASNKYFVFILSTRSGGVGINLTGADTVIFYDSDWNPTMDAQAQDRCHRIGQTRDVHIYRLISERSIEENIVKKANQKRLLGDLAIEGGNFTTAFFKKSTIKDLFDVDQKANETEIITEETTVTNELETSKKATKAFEKAIATVEDNTDLEALKKASEEAGEDEAEFDEEVKPDDGLDALRKRLTAVEKYALQFIENSEKFWKDSQLAAIDAEIQAQKKEFDAKKLEEMTEALGTGTSTPTETGSIASEDAEDSSTDPNDGGSEDSDEDTSDDDNESNTEDEEEEDGDDAENDEHNEETEINEDNPLSPRALSTRARGHVRINLWNLDNK